MKGNPPVDYTRTQAPLAAANFMENMNPGPYTLNRIETARYYASAPPGTPLNYAGPLLP